jgi:hypothetical protein
MISPIITTILYHILYYLHENISRSHKLFCLGLLYITIREKYTNLFELIDTVVRITKDKTPITPYIVTNMPILSALIVLDKMPLKYGRTICFDFQKESIGDVVHYGYIQALDSKIESGFDVHLDKNAPNDQILVQTAKKLSIIKVYNYPL